MLVWLLSSLIVIILIGWLSFASESFAGFVVFVALFSCWTSAQEGVEQKALAERGQTSSCQVTKETVIYHDDSPSSDPYFPSSPTDPYFPSSPMMPGLSFTGMNTSRPLMGTGEYVAAQDLVESRVPVAASPPQHTGYEYRYDLRCPPGAPDELRTSDDVADQGSRIAVLWDPLGQVSARPVAGATLDPAAQFKVAREVGVFAVILAAFAITVHRFRWANRATRRTEWGARRAEWGRTIRHVWKLLKD